MKDMRFNRSGSSVAPKRLLLAMALLLVAVCTLVASGSDTRAQATVPAAPTGLTAPTVAHDSITLSWDDPGDSSITGYQVLRRSRDGDEYGDGRGAAEFVAVVDDTGSSATTYTDTSVTARTRYVYRVKARNSHGLSEKSSYVRAETTDAPSPTSPPSMPTGLAVSSTSHDGVTLTWDNPGDSSITGYQVLRRDIVNQPPGTFATVQNDTGSAVTTYTDTSVAARTRYVYRVKARNPQGLSEASSYANAETTDTPQPAPPSTPTGLAVSSASHDSMTLTWDDPGDSTIESYQILRRSRDGSEYGDGLGDAEFVVIVDDTGSPTTTYTDTSVAPRTRYVYRVKARNPHGLSGASSSANAETLEAPPDTPQSPVRGSRPNVVLILTDDLGWGDIRSNYPDSAMTTPRIDGIAAAGVNFTDAHSPSAACTGTRYGLLTGRYSWRSWMKAEVLNGYDRPLIGPDRPTLGTLLQGHGYRTAAVGKWHLGMDFARLSNLNEVTEVNRGIDFAAEIADSPIDHGFDEFFGTSANLTWHVPVYIRNNRFTAIPHGVTLPATGNIEANEVLDRLTEEAVAFIERAGENEDPFFLYLPLNAPHLPLAPNDHFNRQTDLGAYGDFVAQIDWTVGQVLDTLRRVGEHDNTIVILTSDNGSFMGRLPNDASNDHTSSYNTLNYRVGTHQSNAGWRYGKGSIYEGGHRIPFLLQWPAAIETGSAVDATVSLTDMYATLADIVGEEAAPGIAPDSVSLLPLLLGEAETRGGPVVHHSTYGTFAVRDGRWKLVFHDPRELYDLEQSPGERNNLAAAHPEVVARLEATLARIRSSEDGTMSDDATLRSLLLAGIDLGQFDPNVRTYAATVGREIATVEVIAIPTETDARAGISTPEGQLLYGKPLRGRVEVELADPATTITVRVVAADGSATVDYTVTVTRPEEPPDGPTIAGTAQVGETLTADTSGIADEDGLGNVNYGYQWIRNDGSDDADISGATGQTYTLVSADQGKTIQVRVSFTDDAGNDETLTSAATAAVAAKSNSPASGLPTISGNAQVGETLTADTTAIADEDGLTDATFSYQWVSNDGSADEDIQDATASTYTPMADDQGKAIKVRVSFTDDGGNDETLTSAATAAVAAAPNTPVTGAPTISGTAQVGETLTADTSGIADEDGLGNVNYGYQWIATDGNTDTDIEGATNSTYDLTTAEVGKTIKVRVTFTDDAGYQETPLSAATPTVPFPAVPLVSTNVQVKTGASRELVVSWEAPSDGRLATGFKVQWESGTEAFDGSAGSTRQTVLNDASTLTSIITGLTNGIEHKVRVIAYNAVGDGPPSAEVTGIPEAPNIIVIFVDDVGYADIGFSASSLGRTSAISTPNLDRLANEGITFTNGYATSPLCSPSRAGLLTGRYPARFGMESNLAFNPLDESLGLTTTETLLPTYLKSVGYATGIVGKWHLGMAKKFTPLERGFDDFFGFLGGSHQYFEVDASAPGNKAKQPLVDNTTPLGLNGYLTDVLTDKAIEFVTKERSVRPFFLYLPYNAPHSPYQAPKTLMDQIPSSVTDPETREYLAMVLSVDQNVGRLLTALDQAEKRDNTIVFFLSDQGGISSGPMNNGDLRGGKRSLYEGGLRVPFIASWPARWPQDQTFDPMVISLDITATVLDLALATVADTNRPIDGVNLDPYLRGEQTGAPHETLFWRKAGKDSKVQAVRSGDLKLIQHDSQTPELYDLATDIGEETNVASHDDYEGKAKELANLWNIWNEGNTKASHIWGIPNYVAAFEEWLDEHEQNRLDWVEEQTRHQITIDAGNDETLTSAPTARVASSSNHPAAGLPTIRGQVRVGATLRVSLSALDDADGLSSATFTYQWLADDVEIQDATDSTYVLDADNEGGRPSRSGCPSPTTRATRRRWPRPAMRHRV